LQQEAAAKKERATTSDEQRERALIAEQIARGTESAVAAPETPTEEIAAGIQREEGAAPIKLSLDLKKKDAGDNAGNNAASEAGPSGASTSSTKPAGIVLSKNNTFKLAAKPATPLKGNVFKAASKTGASQKRGRVEDTSLEESKKRRTD
jgi:DNA/RNA-binding protein KIN17